ncbi:LacI family DNA-binding transcriptional regulator [Lederbergia citrea]|uniref:LacI family DNA-binding transcriptional regulator n=1 Tax=Lederbergia citrea TaxID=2833581 RepID=A0A942Z4P9_9BACI|nr:LacI family DNA-binding transcriptional regulator [Lederbergia citrea]MBS4222642.1 LacI family DNA-binding transcriptional regulator [Lederbergia citrea]
MVSMKDIAKKAGVSIATVSYALNGSTKITEATAEKILAIAKDLNYVPNAAARSLKKRETKIIGIFFIPDYSGGFFGQILQGIYDALRNTEYELIVCNGKNSHRFLPEQVIDGAIVLDVGFTDEELIKNADLGHKIVVLDRELEHPNINQILLDNKAGATLAIDYLLEEGHRKLYIVRGSEDAYDANQRLLAVRQAIEQYKRYYDIEYKEIEGDFDRPSGTRAAEIIVEEYTEPCAVFSLNDNMAIGMYDYLANTKYRIGEHIHIIGFDNIELSRYVTPSLATIDYSKRKWGALAAENLLKLIAKEPVKNEQIYTSLIKGMSVQKR